MQTEMNPMWPNPHSPPHDWLPKMLNWIRISKSIQSNSFPLEWQRFCQKLLHFGPFCIALNFKGSQLWKVELIRDFSIHLSTFLFSAPCVGGVSFVVENLKRGESLKACGWVVVVLDSYFDDPVFKPSTLLCPGFVVSCPKFNSFAVCCV